MVNAFTLRSIVNVETLQEIQERFSGVTGLGVIIADDQGVPVTSPTNFTNFCKHMRSSQEGMRCCVWSDKKVGLIAAKQAKPSTHYCHSGLVDIAAPIVLNDKHLGSVLCGQVLLEDQDEKQLDKIREKTKHLPIDQELLQLYFEKIEFTSQKKIEASTEMLQLVANYIV
ncbi:histidine kinase, partial [Shigella flexneri]|nr:histidine kinase [Shigella flexneri]